MNNFKTDIYSVLVELFEKKYKITYGYYIIVDDLINVHVLDSGVVVNDNHINPSDSSFIDFSSPSFLDDVLSVVYDRLKY